MTEAEIIKSVNSFLIEDFEADPDVLLPENDMRASLQLDSLDYIDIVVAVEENFGFRMKAEDFTHIKTFQDFYRFIAQKAIK